MEPGLVSRLINSNLPNSILPLQSSNEDLGKTFIKKVIVDSIPSSDINNLESDLKWNFMLAIKKNLLKKSNVVKRKKTFLTRRQRKDMNLLKLAKNTWKYDVLESLRQIWRNYMNENLDFVLKAPDCTHQDWNSFSTILSKSEFVGAEVKIIKSKVPNQVGIYGTIVLETKMTFQIVTKKSELKSISKSISVFEIRLNKMRFIIYGKRITTRPSERSVKKIKLSMLPIL